MAPTEGNGSTPERFRLGLIVASPGVQKTLGATNAGREYVEMCLGLHASGEWGTVDTETQIRNERNASDSGIASGGTVVGIYPIPTFAQTDGLAGDSLMIGTLATPIGNGLVSLVATALLLESEYDDDQLFGSQS